MASPNLWDRFYPRGVSRTVADLQARRYREMSPAEKLSLADGLGDVALSFAMAGIRLRRPDLDDGAVQALALK